MGPRLAREGSGGRRHGRRRDPGSVSSRKALEKRWRENPRISVFSVGK